MEKRQQSASFKGGNRLHQSVPESCGTYRQILRFPRRKWQRTGESALLDADQAPEQTLRPPDQPGNRGILQGTRSGNHSHFPNMPNLMKKHVKKSLRQLQHPSSEHQNPGNTSLTKRGNPASWLSILMQEDYMKSALSAEQISCLSIKKHRNVPAKQDTKPTGI